MTRGERTIVNAALRERAGSEQSMTGWPRIAALTRIVLVCASAISYGCVSSPKSVTDASIDCAMKQCAAACRWYEKAEAGNPKMQVRIGEMYANSQSCFPKDDETAVEWYRKAATQGDARAMYRLGEAYSYGRGVGQDELKAMAWYRRAATSNGDEALGNFFNKHGTESAAAAYRRLRANNASTLLRNGALRVAEIELLSVSSRWRDGRAVLGKPRGTAGNVTGRLGSSGVVGGYMFIAGGPVGAAIYGGLMALAAIKTGIEDGRAAGAIHEELNSLLVETDLDQMVREEMRSVLKDSGLVPIPKVVPVIADQASSLLGSGEVRIDIELNEVTLENLRHAWQFEAAQRPALVLNIEATMHASSPGMEAAPIVYHLTYKGMTTLDGLKDSFDAETRNAARHLASEILLELAQIDGVEPVPTALQ